MKEKEVGYIKSIPKLNNRFIFAKQLIESSLKISL